MNATVAAQRRAHRIGATLMTACALAWAFGTIASKHTLDVTDAKPSAVLLVQLGASIAFLGAVGLGRHRPSRTAWRTGWVGLLEPGLSYQLSLAGLALTSAASASILGSLEPVFVPLLAWAILRRRPGWARSGVSLVATAGSAVVALGGSTDGRSLGGDVLVALGVAAAALYVVLASRHSSAVPPLTAALVQQVWAMGIVVPVTVVSVLASGGALWPHGGAGGLALASGSGIVNYALPFWLYLSALTRLHVATAAVYLTLIPVFGVVLAVVLLGEPTTGAELVGGVLGVASLIVGTRLDRQRSAAARVDMAAPDSAPDPAPDSSPVLTAR